MKLSNYIFSKLVAEGIDTVFLVTGGGAMHLNDAIGRTAGLKFVCNHNEQASSIAAEGYARVKNKPAIVNVTTGPGSINSLNSAAKLISNGATFSAHLIFKCVPGTGYGLMPIAP